MKKASYSINPCRNNALLGFQLIEVLLASTIFLLIVTFSVSGYLYGSEATSLSGNRERALFIAEEGIEAVRNIRDETFLSLSDGAHGLSRTGNIWSFEGSSDTTDIFTRTVAVSTVDAGRKNIDVTVTWKQNEQRNGSITLSTRMTNWKNISTIPLCTNQADKLSIDTTGASLGQGNRRLENILLLNTDSTCSIEFDKITVVWTDALRNITRIRIDNSQAWAGSATTGTLLDITNTLLDNNDGSVESTYLFSGNMSGNTFTIVFTMSDATTKIEAGIAP